MMPIKKRLAIIASRFPYPLNKGDKLRLFHQIKYLSDHFDIYLYAINEESISLDEQNPLISLCKEIKLFNLSFIQKVYGISKSFLSKEPIQVGYFSSTRIRKEIKQELIEKKIDLTYCQLSRTAIYGLCFKGPVVFDYQDCFSKNYERAYQNSTGIKKIFYKREWQSMRRYEIEINNNFNAKTIISNFDKKSLPFPSDQVHVIPNGVDPSYYKKKETSKEFDILFSGNLDYQPNVDAALQIIDTLYPLLKRQMPHIQIGIAGNTHNKKILSAGNENITIVSDVKDMRTMYSKTRVYIAPLFSGAGLQNKLLEAMSMGIPCIATHITNLSLQAQPDKEIIEVSTHEELFESTIALLNNPKKQEALALEGQAFVKRNYAWETANEKLRQIMENLL